MTTEQVLIQEIRTLPEHLKQEVLHFVQFLKQRQTTESVAETPRKKRKEGSAKEMFVMTEAFDKLLAEFSEYMSK